MQPTEYPISLIDHPLSAGTKLVWAYPFKCRASSSSTRMQMHLFIRLFRQLKVESIFSQFLQFASIPCPWENQPYVLKIVTLQQTQKIT